MAIEKIEFLLGTQAAGSGSSAYDRAWAVYDEGCRYISQIAGALRASAIFTQVIEQTPPPPQQDGSDTVYRTLSNYKAIAMIGDVPVITISGKEFSSSTPANNVIVYPIGATYVFPYQSGSTTYSGGITKGYAGKTTKKVCIDVAYVTSNGVLFRSVIDRATNDASGEVNKQGELLIVKSNGQYPMIISGPTTNLTTYHGIGQIAHNALVIGNYEDNSVIESSIYPTTSGSFDPKHYFQFSTSAKQSVLVPFAGVGGAEKFTFTPKGFWIPLAPTAIREGGLQKMHIDGRNCVTDGYWALQDG